jgi:hypothetical protein
VEYATRLIVVERAPGVHAFGFSEKLELRGLLRGAGLLPFGGAIPQIVDRLLEK